MEVHDSAGAVNVLQRIAFPHVRSEPISILKDTLPVNNLHAFRVVLMMTISCLPRLPASGQPDFTPSSPAPAYAPSIPLLHPRACHRGDGHCRSKHSRCLVVADGFYEWKKGANAKTKQPHYIRLKKDRPFAFAGLAEHWSRNGETIDSCTLITTDPNELMAEIHDRMPAILSPGDCSLWLDREFEGKETLVSLLRPYRDDEMEAYPISTLVNSPNNDVAAALKPVREVLAPAR
jgi:hypothetical protein